MFTRLKFDRDLMAKEKSINDKYAEYTLNLPFDVDKNQYYDNSDKLIAIDSKLNNLNQHHSLCNSVNQSHEQLTRGPIDLIDTRAMNDMIQYSKLDMPTCSTRGYGLNRIFPIHCKNEQTIEPFERMMSSRLAIKDNYVRCKKNI